ncbi:DUF559 domain-containing protein [bacterium]|nr:DUF559 domain-containing protein [bacterium]
MICKTISHYKIIEKLGEGGWLLSTKPKTPNANAQYLLEFCNQDYVYKVPPVKGGFRGVFFNIQRKNYLRIHFIEIDGITYNDKEQADRMRQREIEKMGLRFLRFYDSDVRNNLNGVLISLVNWIEKVEVEECVSP